MTNTADNPNALIQLTHNAASGRKNPAKAIVTNNGNSRITNRIRNGDSVAQALIKKDEADALHWTPTTAPKARPAIQTAERNKAVWRDFWTKNDCRLVLYCKYIPPYTSQPYKNVCTHNVIERIMTINLCENTIHQKLADCKHF